MRFSPLDTFRTADGDGDVAIGVATDREWHILAAIGRRDLEADERFMNTGRRNGPGGARTAPASSARTTTKSTQPNSDRGEESLAGLERHGVI